MEEKRNKRRKQNKKMNVRKGDGGETQKKVKGSSNLQEP